jgi:hypothetical protein
METKLELFKNVIYYMFKEGVLPECDFDDFTCMWSALMDKWEIKMEEEKWERFIYVINCKKSDDYIWFSEIFNKYFYEKI